MQNQTRNKIIFYIVFVLIISLTAIGIYYREIFHPMYQKYTGEIVWMGIDIGSDQMYMLKGYGDRQITLRLLDNASLALSEALEENVTITLITYIDPDNNYNVSDIITCKNMRIKYLDYFNERLNGEEFTCKKEE